MHYHCVCMSSEKRGKEGGKEGGGKEGGGGFFDPYEVNTCIIIMWTMIPYM